MHLPHMVEAEAQFTSSMAVYPDCEQPVNERWSVNLRGCPELAKVSLAADLTPLFQKAFDEWTDQKLMCVFDAARLRFHLFFELYKSTAIPAHIALQGQQYSEYWANKLYNKIQQASQTRRQAGRIRHAKAPEKVVLRWLN